MNIQEKDEFIFQHLIDMFNFNCTFCSTRERSTGKTRLFLVFNQPQRIYVRNPMKESWDEIKGKDEKEQVLTGFNNAVREKNIPCFTTSNSFEMLTGQHRRFLAD